jgi:hypothetical protein
MSDINNKDIEQFRAAMNFFYSKMRQEITLKHQIALLPSGSRRSALRLQLKECQQQRKEYKKYLT